jgi:hypothetical protein
VIEHVRRMWTTTPNIAVTDVVNILNDNAEARAMSTCYQLGQHTALRSARHLDIPFAAWASRDYHLCLVTCFLTVTATPRDKLDPDQLASHPDQLTALT